MAKHLNDLTIDHTCAPAGYSSLFWRSSLYWSTLSVTCEYILFNELNFWESTLEYCSQVRLYHLSCVVLSSKTMENQESPEVNTLKMGGKFVFFCSLSLFCFFNCYFVFLGTFKEEGCRINKSIIAGARKWGGCVSLHCWADSSQQVQSFPTVCRFHRLSIRDLRRYNLNTLEKVCMFFQMSRCQFFTFIAECEFRFGHMLLASTTTGRLLAPGKSLLKPRRSKYFDTSPQAVSQLNLTTGPVKWKAAHQVPVGRVQMADVSTVGRPVSTFINHP